MGSPVALGDLAKDEKLLWLHCNDCGRERDVEPLLRGLPEDLPEDLPVCRPKPLDGCADKKAGQISQFF